VCGFEAALTLYMEKFYPPKSSSEKIQELKKKITELLEQIKVLEAEQSGS
jgi:hypothetical protein